MQTKPFGSITLIAAAASLGVATQPASAITIKDFGYEYWHLEQGAQQDAVGFLSLYEATIDEDTSEVIEGALLGTCSGSVIGDQYFLTAGHCTIDAGLMNIEINGQVYQGAEWYVPTEYEAGDLGHDDVSIIKIDGTFDSAIPRLRYNGMNGSTPFATAGKDVEIVGFGTFGTGEVGAIFPAGTRRSAFNELDVEPIAAFSEPGFNVLLYDFDPPQTSVFFDFGPDFDWDTESQQVLESSAAPGDSGGPVLFDGSDIIAGVTSFGFGIAPSLSLYTIVGGSANVADWSDWIDAILADSPTGVKTGTPGNSIADADAAAAASEASAEILLDALAEQYGAQILVFGEPGSGLAWGRAGADSQPLPGENSTFIIGDLDRDGDVDDTDLGILLANWQENTYNWQEGNLTYDAVVDDIDLGLMLANWTGELTPETLAHIASVTGNTVPEPTSLVLLGLAGLGLIRRRPMRR